MKKLIQVSIYDLEGHLPMELVEQAWFCSLSSALDFAYPSLNCPELLVKFQWCDDEYLRGFAL